MDREPVARQSARSLASCCSASQSTIDTPGLSAAWRARGGVARLIVGIDEGIATRPGLILALRHFSEVYVLHDRPGLTFHPKLYLAEGETSAELLVGSGNLTAGGLFSNYEAALQVTFSLPEEHADPALSQAREYIDRLLNDTQICLNLDEDLVERLAE